MKQIKLNTAGLNTCMGIILLTMILITECTDSGDTNPNEPTPDLNLDTTNKFQNPLLSKGADPWVLKKDGMYFYTHTTGNRLDLRATASMENLNQAEQKTIWTPPKGEEYSRALWAPELHYLHGKWYMYFAASYDSGEENSVNENRRMFVIENSSENPMEGEWEFKGKVADDTDKWAIDGTILDYEDEKYFIWSGWRGDIHATNTGRQQLYIAKMTNPWALEGNRVMISEPEFKWEKNGLINEGPVILKNEDEDIFLFYSASGCWTDDYKIGVLELIEDGDPLNPENWKKHPEPMFEKSVSNNVYGPGHNSFFKSPDGTEDWIFYHANDNSGDGCGAGRSPRMQKISWDEDGFPDLGEPESKNTTLTIPSTDSLDS